MTFLFDAFYLKMLSLGWLMLLLKGYVFAKLEQEPVGEVSAKLEGGEVCVLA